MARSARGRFPQTRDLRKRASVGERVGRRSLHAVSRSLRSSGFCGFRGVFSVRRLFFVFFFQLFLRTHTACCKYEAASCLIYLSTTNEAGPRERSDRGRFLPLWEEPLQHEARPRERRDRGRFLPIGIKASSYRGA